MYTYTAWNEPPRASATMRRNAARPSAVRPVVASSWYTRTTSTPSRAAAWRHTRTWSSMDSSRWPAEL
nr:hypothetical protein [uncultured Parolsenella sp.]